MRVFATITLVFLQTITAAADHSRDLSTLMALLKIDETIEIMHDEGARYGADIAREMLPGADQASWKDTVARIYDQPKMQQLIRRGFHRELAETDLSSMLDYFGTEEGQEIVQIELAARRFFLDPDTEAAAIIRFENLKREGAPLVAIIDTLIDDSDLVEFNVMGTLNSSLMFYRGLNDGGAFDMSEAEMLSDVWSQEDETRVDSRQWLEAFLAVAYQPLEPAQLERYAAFYRTPEGRVLNRAIFAAFDKMYEETSYLLGLAVAEHMTSEPL